MEILLLTVLFTKHLILDFIYQPPYQWQNKGTYGHPGGIVHAGQHVIGSMILLFWFPWAALWPVLIAEFIIHYHMDWFKMWWGARKEYGPNTHVEFWHWLGIDQWVHSLTYLSMIWYLI